MVWFVNRVYPYVERIWRRLCYIWRCVISISAPLVGRTLSAIGFRKSDPGNQGEPEQSDESKLPKTSVLVRVEGGYCEGQHEAAAEKKTAGCNREDVLQEPECEEDEDDEFNGEEYRVETTDEFYCDYDSTWETKDIRDTFKRNSRPATSTHVSKQASFKGLAAL